MKDWNWDVRNNGPIAYLNIEFVTKDMKAGDFKSLISGVLTTGFIRATPDVVESLTRIQSQTDYYFDTESYPHLPFFTGRNYYGSFYTIVVTDTGISCERYGHKDPEKAVTNLLQSLVHQYGLVVSKWDIFCGGEGYSRVDIAHGDHTDLLTYLEF